MILARPCYDSIILKACSLAEEDLNTVIEMLKNYLILFKPCYHRSEQKNRVDNFITGHLSDLDRKSIEPVAFKNSGSEGFRTMQMFLKYSPFDNEMMLNLCPKSIKQTERR